MPRYFTVGDKRPRGAVQVWLDRADFQKTNHFLVGLGTTYHIRALLVKLAASRRVRRPRVREARCVHGGAAVKLQNHRRPAKSTSTWKIPFPRTHQTSIPTWGRKRRRCRRTQSHTRTSTAPTTVRPRRRRRCCSNGPGGPPHLPSRGPHHRRRRCRRRTVTPGADRCLPKQPWRQRSCSSRARCSSSRAFTFIS